MAKFGFYFDTNKCIGCRACQVACKDKNRLDVGTIYRKQTSYCVGKYPDAKVFHYSATCNHCENPACLLVCAAGAIYKTEDGAVIIDENLCDGCMKCVEACPYGVPQFIEEKGVAGKCDSCKVSRDKGEKPACVSACPMRCIDCGDVDELAAKYGGDLVKDIPILPDSSISEPGLLIKAKESALSEDFEEMYL